jgi:hypothetical protein
MEIGFTQECIPPYKQIGIWELDALTLAGDILAGTGFGVKREFFMSYSSTNETTGMRLPV